MAASVNAWLSPGRWSIEPKVLLLDEPLGALDLKLREEMQMELKTIQRDVGITFVFVTHDQGEALSMSSRVAVFNNGRVEQVGTPQDIYERPTTAFVAGFVGTSNLINAAQSQELMGLSGAHTIRPERISIAETTAQTDDRQVVVDGTITDVQYLGAECRVRVALDGGAQLLVSLPSDRLAAIALGDSLRLCWPRSAAFSVAERMARQHNK